eukprot:jgi/Botrbrau1/20447/Bobra.145_2s0011.1
MWFRLSIVQHSAKKFRKKVEGSGSGAGPPSGWGSLCQMGWVHCWSAVPSELPGRAAQKELILRVVTLLLLQRLSV